MNSLALRGLGFLSGTFGAAIKIGLIIIIAYPFAWMFFTAFKPFAETLIYPPVLLPQQWTTEGFVNAMNTIDVWHYLRNSIIIVISVLATQFLVVVPAAYGFARCRFKLKTVFFSIVLLGFMIPIQVTFIPIFLMFSDMGILQSYLPQILPFMANAFGIFLLRQYFMQIPEEIIEAARLDNAKELQIILKIMIPMAKTALITLGLFTFISNWNSYFWPLIITTTDTFRPLPVGVAWLNNVETAITWNMVMAGNLFLVGPILLVYIFASKQIRRAFVYTGIK